MRITESQLRRIIRQEARRLTEMPARRPAAGRGRARPPVGRSGAKKGWMGETYSSIARNIVADFEDGLEPYQLAEYAIEATAEFEPGYEPEYAMGEFNNRMKVIGDESNEILKLVMGMNPEAGAALEQGLSEFTGF